VANGWRVPVQRARAEKAIIAAGKTVAVDNVSCTEGTGVKPHTYVCTSPTVNEATAKLFITNFIARKIAGKKAGDLVTYTVSSIRCTSHDVEVGDEGRIPADECEVTK
jgi:hypothetical protein